MDEMGPNQAAALFEESIEKLEKQLADCKSMKARKRLQKRLALCRQTLSWCKSRAGYVKPS